MSNEGSEAKAVLEMIDGIIYEPVRLFCDVLRQPLKELDRHRELRAQKDMEQFRSELQKDVKKFEAELEEERKDRDMRREAARRRLEEEINRMAMDRQLEQRSELVRMEIRFRQEMAVAAAELSRIMADIQVETRDRILGLYSEKMKEYLEIQERYKTSMFDTVKQLKELLPEDSGGEMMLNTVLSQTRLMEEQAKKFFDALSQDMANVFKNINGQLETMSNAVSAYLRPSLDKPALTEGLAGGIPDTK